MSQDELSAEEALEEISSLCDLIDDEVPEYALDKAPDFFESIREQASDMSETIERTQEVTEKQVTAIRNWREGVEKWIY